MQDTFYGWNTWQLLKKPLYYSVKDTTFKVKKRNLNNSPFNLIYSTLRIFFNVFKLFVFKRGRPLFYTNANYKLEKLNGKHIDVFFDYLIIKWFKRKVVYVESNVVKDPKNVAVKKDLHTDDMRLLLFIVNKLFVNKYVVSDKAKRIVFLLNDFFRKEGYSFVIEENKVCSILSRFYADYLLNKMLFRIVSPKAICMVDGIPTGAMAAGRNLGIPVYEFQHGFIIKDKPDYIMSGYLKSLYYKMVLPDYIFVFGEFFRENLLESGFWNHNQIRSLGNFRVDKLRKSFSRKTEPNDTLKILFATQPSTFEHTKKFLLALKDILPSSIVVSIKCHVREPKNNNDWYQSYVNNENTKYLTPDLSLMELMKEHEILVSYHSTAIFEVLGLGMPAVTIGTEEFPRGINSLVNVNISDVLKDIRSADEFVKLFMCFKNDILFRERWLGNCQKNASYFYDEKYDQNLDDFSKTL